MSMFNEIMVLSQLFVVLPASTECTAGFGKHDYWGRSGVEISRVLCGLHVALSGS
jgi:hypothetical protein